MSRDTLRSEEGVALVYVLLALVIISGLIVVFMQRTLFEMRATAQGASWESAIHVAEGGAESLFAHINREGDEKVVTEGPLGDEHVYDPEENVFSKQGWTDADLRAYERAWAIELAEQWINGAGEIIPPPGAGYAFGIIQTDDGHAFGVRPRMPESDDVWDIVFGVGFVPSIHHDNPTIRIVKMKINQYFYSPDHALLAGGSMYLSGSASIKADGCATDPDDCDADVHSNGDVRGNSNATTVEGSLTATGSTGGFTTVTGPGTSPVQPIEPPDVRARDFYGRQGAEGDSWYDLCPDGTVRPLSGQPCGHSTVLWTVGDDTTGYNGWRFHEAQGNHLPEWRSTNVHPGTYYVHHGNVKLTGSAGVVDVSIIVAADSTRPETTGSMELGGNARLNAAIPGVLLVTDGDLQLGGTQQQGQQLTGYIFVGEQLHAQGNVTVNGAILVADRADKHPWVRRSNHGTGGEGTRVSGNLTLNYDRDLVLNLSGVVTIEFWNEL